MERLGLSYEACRELRPDLVYCAVSAFDTHGANATRGGNDTGMQAVSGFMSLNGDPDGEPMRAGIPVIDMTAALFVTQSVLAALRTPPDSPHRHVEVSLMNAAAALQTLPITECLNTGETPGRHGNRNPFIAPAGAYAGSDGRYFTVSCLRDSHWHRLCEVVGRPDLPAVERYATNALRVHHRAELNVILDEVFAARPAAEWVELLHEQGVLCAAVNELDTVVSEPGLGDTLPVIDAGPARTLGHPVRFGGTFPSAPEPPAPIGAHTREVLAELGYDDAEIDALLAAGIAAGTPVADPSP